MKTREKLEELLHSVYGGSILRPNEEWLLDQLEHLILEEFNKFAANILAHAEDVSYVNSDSEDSRGQAVSVGYIQAIKKLQSTKDMDGGE